MKNLDLDEITEAKAVTVAGLALGLNVPIWSAVKIHYDRDKGHDVPLGSVLIMPQLRWWHFPVWWWKKAKVRKAVRDVIPAERQVFVYPARGLEGVITDA